MKLEPPRFSALRGPLDGPLAFGICPSCMPGVQTAGTSAASLLRAGAQANRGVLPTGASLLMVAIAVAGGPLAVT